ncbi:MAG: substrate-binding domain-containing protein [Clostridiales bacterium]|nr:substrate-binding domain-containing protein [Clostridiales bacterium]
MKKLLTLMLALAMLVGVALPAVAQSNTGDAYVFWYTYGDVYLSSVREALNNAFDAAGIKYVDNDANGNQNDQMAQIDTAITANAALLAVNVVETGSEGTAQGIVDKAKEANLPLVFYNRSVDEKIVTSYDRAVYVGTDYEEAGQMQGDLIGDYLIENYEALDLNGDGVISYVMFKGDEANQEAISRTKFGVENANAKLVEAGKPELVFYDENNGDKYLVDQNGQWSNGAAFEYMSTILAQYNEENNNMIELVIANNDDMALGAINALTNIGFNNGEEGAKVIPVFGVDATDTAKDLIASGRMVGTIKQDAEGMADAIATVSKNLMEGKDKFENLNEGYVIEGTWRVNIPYAPYTGE